MLGEVGENPQVKKVMKVAAAVIGGISTFEAILDFPGELAKHEHIILTLVGVIFGLVILIACYVLVYGFFFVIVMVVGLLLHLIFRRGKLRAETKPWASTKWMVGFHVIALVLTVCLSIGTHGRIMSVFTYWSDKKEKEEYNKNMERDLRECLSHSSSDVAKQFCHEQFDQH